MADKYETIGGVAATAERFDPAAGNIPAACVADGQDWRFASEGYRVDTNKGVSFPVTGDWIVTIDGSVIVVGAKAFATMFKASAAEPVKKTAKR